MSAKWTRALASLGMLAVSLSLSLLVAEGVVRLVQPQPRLVITPGGFYTADPPGRYRLSPGYRGRIYNRAEYDNRIRINEHGLRGENVEEGSDQVLRLLSIGDSFVFGVGVEDAETFTALIPGAISSVAPAAEGLNAGIPAFGVPDAVSWLTRHGLDLDPDMVILSIFQGNDLVDASAEQEEILLVDGLLVPAGSAGGVKAWMFRHSHLYVLLKNLVEQPGFTPLRTRLGLAEPWKMRVLREEFGVYKTSVRQDLATAIEATDSALAELSDLATERGLNLIAVLIPSEIQVDPERWVAGLSSLGLDPKEYEPSMPTQIFTELLGRHAIPTLDLGPRFAEGLAAGEDLYYQLDRHWTSLGHEVAAQEIGAFLVGSLNEEGPSDETGSVASEEPGDPD